jgi:hypothetical protein
MSKKMVTDSLRFVLMWALAPENMNQQFQDFVFVQLLQY